MTEESSEAGEKYCITLNDVKEAAERIKEHIVRTPLLNFHNLADECGCELYLKLENLQRCKAFKFRGALSKVKKVPKGKTVCAVSAGNHSQGVALASTLCGCKSVIYMPANAMITKVQATASYGAQVIQEGNCFDDAKAAMTRALEQNKDWIFIPPFDDPDIMAGQGTIALEIVEDLPDVNTVVVPIGGGGLAAGVSLALKKLNKNIKVIGVQMTSSPATYRKFYEHYGKKPKVIAQEQKSPLADGIAVKSPGKLCLDIIYDFMDDVVVVSEDEVATAISMMAERGKIIAEGAGAVAFAAIYNKKFKFFNKDKIVAIVSGGNIPLQMLGRCIDRALFLRSTRVSFSVVMPYDSVYLKDLVDIVVNNKAQILDMHLERQSDTFANNEHCNIVIDAPTSHCLDQIKTEFREKGWSFTVANTTAIAE
ncbi:hypothetical protein M9Y10_033646 [Tritrichomonas musculus]|uniref:Tryptophan synthase beta chain-like PALP domain-containing protein n=1 Tax=Tritrichomonas musculus TaxID=1915356 RepID=A0ABR2KDR8_9EUKA